MRRKLTPRVADRLSRTRRRVSALVDRHRWHSEERWLVAERGWQLHAQVHRPANLEDPAPAVVLVPGIEASGSVFEREGQVIHVRDLVRLGCVVLTLDLSGRGRSWGNEDYGGPDQQGDVRVALRHLAQRRDVDTRRLGVLSISLGAVAVAGALASEDRPSVAWWLDWEGPSDREIITAGGTRMDPADGHPLDDERYWRYREPVRQMDRIRTPYLRYQSAEDHAQPGELRHALRMLHAASQASLPFFQLNEHDRNEVPANPDWMPPGQRAARRWLIEQVRLLHRLP